MTGPDYIIGPGDTVQVFVWRNPELSVTVPVRPDGKISTPLVEDMVAVGKTSSQLARDIEKVLAEYVRVAASKHNCHESGQHLQSGEGDRAGATAVGALPRGPDSPGCDSRSGRPDPVRRGQSCEDRSQNEAGKTVEIKVRLESLVKKGKMAENVDLQPGDVIIVPESFLAAYLTDGPPCSRSSFEFWTSARHAGAFAGSRWSRPGPSACSAGRIVFSLPDVFEAAARVYVDSQTALGPLLHGLAARPERRVRGLDRAAGAAQPPAARDRRAQERSRSTRQDAGSRWS